MNVTREVHQPDVTFRWILMVCAWVAFLLLTGFFIFLFDLGWPALRDLGLKLFTLEWNPPLKVFGMLSFIYGTLMTSILALLIATPVSVASAVVLSELAPKRTAKVFGFLVEMLAAIPSIVYGLWGLFFLVPALREAFMPFVQRYFGALPIFSGPIYGVSVFSAAVILAIMVIPTITAVCREVFGNIPQVQRDGMLALGATRFEMIKIAVLDSSRSGIFGAMVLGLGRALGETMAVTMLIGNSSELDYSWFAPGQTMASAMASEVAEASGTHLAALGMVGFVLLLISALVFYSTKWALKGSGK
jgi:phosphate transport system permease protein